MRNYGQGSEDQDVDRKVDMKGQALEVSFGINDSIDSIDTTEFH